ncbi:MAG: ribosome silencing factor [Chloroflexi bacterium]|nr:ribosome silencing factor [Chloroflexota bacterium]
MFLKWGQVTEGCAALEPIEVARLAVDAASDKQAVDIVLMDLRGLATFTDYFVICSSDSPPQTAAIANEVQRQLHDKGVRLGHREGETDSGWVLMDFGDVIVNIFSPTARRYYDLEGAWSKAKQLVRVQ